MGNILVKAELNQQAYEKIKQGILQNELPSGTRIVDSKIAEMYGISRTPVRDAIKMLTNEGLIETTDKKGYYVVSISPKDINEIFDIRLMIDKEVITKIITAMLPNNYEYYTGKIDEICATLEKNNNRNGQMFIKQDEKFHDSIIAMTNNAKLIKIYSALRNQTKVFRHLTSFSEERIQQALTFHKKMINAIKDMDLDQAIVATIKHVELSRRDALEDIRHLQEAKR